MTIYALWCYDGVRFINFDERFQPNDLQRWHWLTPNRRWCLLCTVSIVALQHRNLLNLQLEQTVMHFTHFHDATIMHVTGTLCNDKLQKPSNLHLTISGEALCSLCTMRVKQVKIFLLSAVGIFSTVKSFSTKIWQSLSITAPQVTWVAFLYKHHSRHHVITSHRI